MELEAVLREKYDKNYWSQIIVLSVVFIIFNLVVSWYVRDEAVNIAIERASDYYDTGSIEEMRKINTILDTDPYLVFFSNTFKISSFGVFLVYLYNFFNKHWVVYTLATLGGISLFSLFLCSTSFTSVNLETFLICLGRALLYISLPCFMWSLHSYAKSSSEAIVNSYKRLNKND